MSLTGALSVALSGLTTSTTAAQLISGNIANAQTPGYTDKSLDLASVSTGSSMGGVEINAYARVTDSVLTATYNNATSNASYLSTQNGYMSQVQSILDSTEDPPALANDLSNFQAAWTQYGSDPSDTTLQQNVVATGEALAQQIGSIGDQATTLKSNIEGDLSTSVQTLNTDLQQVQSLNVQISTAMAEGQPTVDLQDQRDQTINQIAQYTSVQVLPRANGQVALYTPSGTGLLDQVAQTFSVSTDPTTGDPCVVNNIGVNVDNALTGGTLQAQTDFLSSSNSPANGVGVINKLNSQLTALANLFVSPAAGGFASTYNSATTGTGELPSGFFTATTDANGNVSDVASFAVNANLVNGTSKVKTAAASSVANTFNASNLAINTATTPPTTSSTFSATGLTVQNQTYSGITTAILSGFQQAANAIKGQSSTATTQQTYYQNSLSSETGVNTNTELVNLTSWENSYAASAHVISTIQQMMTTLENLLS